MFDSKKPDQIDLTDRLGRTVFRITSVVLILLLSYLVIDALLPDKRAATPADDLAGVEQPTPSPDSTVPPIPTLGPTLIPGIEITPEVVPTPVLVEEGEWIISRPPEIDDYLTNPNIGWQDIYTDDPRFPQTVAYLRLEWVDLNPAEGVYDWSLLEALRESAPGISFGVKTASSPPWGSGQAVPQWVVDKGSPVVYNYAVSGEEANEPIYTNCVFLEEHGRFIDAMREKYDGDPQVAFIDIRSYGYYGEWHTPQYDDDSEETLDFHARARIVEMYIGGSDTRPCTGADGTVKQVTYSYPGFQSTQLVMPYTPYYDQTLQWMFANRRRDIGIRHDSLGLKNMHDSYREDIGSIVQEIWQTEPIVFELSADAWTDDNLKRARDFIIEMHGSAIHDNFPGLGDTTLMLDMLKVTGYRLVLREMRHEREVAAGDPLTLTMQWENVGSAPSYRAYPLVVYLLDWDGEIAAFWPLQADITTWLPGGTIDITEQVTLPDDIPPGTYDVALAFVDLETEQSVLQLAIVGRDPSGLYRISRVEVSG